MIENHNEATRIELKFSSGLSAFWRLCHHEAANIWLKSLLLNLKSSRLIKSRFLGFVNSKRSEEFLTQELNLCIENINSNLSYQISERFSVGDSQESLNKIHHHFSILIGREGEGSELWNSASSRVKSSICGLNDYVHEIESWRRSGNGGGAYCCIEFFEASGMEVPERWNDLFTMDLNFGDITLHYDQIGKTWLEVLIDKDDSIIDEAIRPLNRITGSFNINFFETSSELLKKEISSQAKKLGLDIDDPHLRLGQLVVAELEETLDPSQSLNIRLQEQVGQDQEIREIIISRGDTILAQRQFDGNLERYFDKVEWK